MMKAIEEFTKKLDEIVTNELERLGFDMKTKYGKETKEFIMYDIVLPNAKDFIERSVRDITQEILWGTRRRSMRRTNMTRYTPYYRSSRIASTNPYEFFRGLTFVSQEKANEWLNDIRTCIDLMGEMNVDEAAEELDTPTNFYNGDKIGWKEIPDDLEICQSSDGNWYIPDFPDPERLDYNGIRDENTDDSENM